MMKDIPKEELELVSGGLAPAQTGGGQDDVEAFRGIRATDARREVTSDHLPPIRSGGGRNVLP